MSRSFEVSLFGVNEAGSLAQIYACMHAINDIPWPHRYREEKKLGAVEEGGKIGDMVAVRSR